MTLESKHINLLNSAAQWLEIKGSCYMGVKLGWTDMMLMYAKELRLIAQELEKLNLPKTVVRLEDLFGNTKD